MVVVIGVVLVVSGFWFYVIMELVDNFVIFIDGVISQGVSDMFLLENVLFVIQVDNMFEEIFIFIVN